MDMSKYLGLFATEASEHLESLGRELALLENAHTPDQIDSIFRHVHSVKGMASSMGFEPITQLAHRAEDLIGVLREDSNKLSRELVDLLLRASDTLLGQVRTAASGTPPPAAHELTMELSVAFEQLRASPAPVAPNANALSSWNAPFGSVLPSLASLTAPVIAEPANGSASTSTAAPAPAAPAAANVGADSARPPTPPLPAQAPAVPTVSPLASLLQTQPLPQLTLWTNLTQLPTSTQLPPVASSLQVTPTMNQLSTTQPQLPALPVLTPAANATETAEFGWARWMVKVKVAASSPTPGVRAFLVHKRLSALGQIFDCRPPLEDLKAGRLPQNQLSLLLETRVGEAAIRKLLDGVSEIESVQISAPGEGAMTGEHAPELLATGPQPVGVEPARTVRVKTEMLDDLLDGVGELLLATANLRELAKSLPERFRPAVDEGIDRLHGIVKGLHGQVMGARMTPLAQITDRLPRAARDIIRKTGREADLQITGAEIELDRAILDELADPVLHLLRNCIGHGIEPVEERIQQGKPAKGRIRVAARRDRDRVLLEIEDDGRGMDPERLKDAAIARGLLSPNQAETLSLREALLLSCLPGVSTAKSVSDLSGRGVGMDAVKRAVENVGGTLEIDSENGRGTRFTLRLPLTVAVLNVLLIGVGEEIYGLPINKVSGAVELQPHELFSSRGSKLLSHAGELVPVHALSHLLSVPSGPLGGLKPFVLVEGDSGKLALEVDRLLGQEEVVLKPLTRPLDRVSGLAGVTILGSGRPIFILDVPRLV